MLPFTPAVAIAALKSWPPGAPMPPALVDMLGKPLPTGWSCSFPAGSFPSRPRGRHAGGRHRE